MSIPGVYSNRGDSYQTLIAFGWALSVLDDSQYDWLEVDSVEYPEVDDVVIGRSDGTLICCQCKKNQTDHKSWSFGDLRGELEKAICLLAGNDKAIVKFYSRTPFGDLSKLREYYETQPNLQKFRENLPAGLLPIYEKLEFLTSSINDKIITYDLIERISYISTDEIDRLEDLLHERLRRLTSNSESAFDAIWSLLDRQGARIYHEYASNSKQGKVTKEVLKRAVERTGAVLGPIQDINAIQLSYHQASSIGRSWKRDINGLILETPLVNEILSAIQEKARSILITGGPGSGKTCLLLNLQEELEKATYSNLGIESLFVQSREFADCNNLQDLEAWGYPKELIKITSRLAEEAHVVVVIDSLDVLSISRDHWILTFFLAQVDQLLSIPNVTVVTACRIFDRHYDYRIAVHTWEREFECEPLSWEDQIVPLLEANNISAFRIEEDTRELTKNPRELELFVELSIRKQDVNSVTSQELAQCYINIVIGDNPSLGVIALEAIEDIADEMLRSRSLVVPRSSFTRPDLLPALQSLNILQLTQNEMIALGHQTLLDVLIVRKMNRRSITLLQFISELPAVPFVRPSIRSFINHLSIGDKTIFRKQMRSVLTSKLPFHIRRLVADTISTLTPSNDDWSLIRDLRRKHKDVFQVIYFNAHGLQWFDFWNYNLVPMLMTLKDSEGLIAHAHRINQWKNDKPKDVLAFWKQILEMNIDPDNQFAFRLDSYLSDIENKHAENIVPILNLLLRMPRREHSLLGHILAKCINAGSIDVTKLWDYIVNDLNDEDVKAFNFNKKLYCMPTEFGSREDGFLSHWMNTSEDLLNLALHSIERWSEIKWGTWNDGRISRWGSFLSATSYEKTHSQHDMYHVDSENILFGTIESSIAYHSSNNSDWWVKNVSRLVDSLELSIRYFVILACTSYPETNQETIYKILTNQEMLESDLSYEICLLIKQSFIHLGPSHQASVTMSILDLYNTNQQESDIENYRIAQKAKYIKCIPAFKRSTEAQRLLDSIETTNNPLVLQPSIHSWGGAVRAPFSYEIFLNNLDDDHIILLLEYYNDFQRDFNEHLIGGREDVGRQLSEAASRNPQRFLDLIHKRTSEINDYFVDEIIGGVAWFLEYKYGDFKEPDNWELIAEPEISYILQMLLNTLDRISKPSNDSYSQSRAIRACAHIITTTEDAFRVIFLSLGYRYVHDDREIERVSNSLISAGINMTKGNVAEALVILANRLIDEEIPFPDILDPALSSFIQDEQPAIKAVILRRLSYFLYYRPDEGWSLINSALHDAEGLWSSSEQCLYQMYYKHFGKVNALIEHLYKTGSGQDYETWGRISALSVLAGHISIEDFIKSLSQLDSENAWKGALTVWTHSKNIKEEEEICLTGIQSSFKSDIANKVVVEEMSNLFRDTSFILLPTEIVSSYLVAIAKSDKDSFRFHGLEEWLNKLAQINPESALDGIESYIECASKKSQYFYDYKNNLTQLMTRLFAEAEEQEESDNGSMLQRVVNTQDKLLLLGVNGITEWLKAAERP